jgi:hypothetical protein
MKRFSGPPNTFSNRSRGFGATGDDGGEDEGSAPRPAADAGLKLEKGPSAGAAPSRVGDSLGAAAGLW